MSPAHAVLSGPCNRYVESREVGVKTGLPTSLYSGQRLSMNPATGNTLYTSVA